MFENIRSHILETILLDSVKAFNATVQINQEKKELTQSGKELLAAYLSFIIGYAVVPLGMKLNLTPQRIKDISDKHGKEIITNILSISKIDDMKGDH